jgi:hypothetical protein
LGISASGTPRPGDTRGLGLGFTGEISLGHDGLFGFAVDLDNRTRNADRNVTGGDALLCGFGQRRHAKRTANRRLILADAFCKLVHTVALELLKTPVALGLFDGIEVDAK